MDRRERLDDPEEALRLALEGYTSGLWTALPGVIVDVDIDIDAMTVSVQPTIQGVNTNAQGNQQFVNLPVLLDVPLVFPSAGGYTLTFPIKEGDEVLVVFASRAIDAWWQSGGIGKPVEARMHDLSDGFAIPGPHSQATKLSDISTASVQLRNDDGDTYIEINDDQEIKMVSPVKITLDAPLTEITGNLIAGTEAGGTAAFNGNITTTADVIAQTVSLHNHLHGGVTTGGGNTGVPNP